MQNSWLDLYQGSVLDTEKIKINTMYIINGFDGAQYTITKIKDSEVYMVGRYGTKVIRNMRWCINNLKQIMIMENL